MTVIFICGCLEPGRDGVGDYVLRLAAELCRTGHKAGALALNDRYITLPVSGLLPGSGTAVSVLRIPAPGRQHLEQAALWIKEFNPEWLSLQYVPFSFHRRGIPLRLSKRLNALGYGRRWHVLFHETWMGIAVQDPAWHRLKGAWQRRLIGDMLRAIRPSVIHTNCGVYEAALARYGVPAAVLPLFSNIEGVRILKRYDDRVFRIVHFGSVHKKNRASAFALELSAMKQQTGIFVTLDLIGYASGYSAFVRSFEQAGIPVNVTGPQSADSIAERIASATIGITTMPLQLAGKSGSVAAMRSFGLPVLCIAAQWEPRIPGVHTALVPGVEAYRENTVGHLLSRKNVPACDTLSEVSLKFVTSLSGVYE